MPENQIGGTRSAFSAGNVCRSHAKAVVSCSDSGSRGGVSNGLSSHFRKSRQLNRFRRNIEARLDGDHLAFDRVVQAFQKPFQPLNNTANQAIKQAQYRNITCLQQSPPNRLSHQKKEISPHGLASV
jgi:hypothetical protein